MCIDIKHGMHIIMEWIRLLNLANLLPENFPTCIIIDLLHLLMKFNIFQFGNHNFIQKSGCAMGTIVAVTLCNLYIGYHEEFSIIPRFKNSIIGMFRQVDDLFVIWKGSTCEFSRFKNLYNNYGILKLLMVKCHLRCLI